MPPAQLSPPIRDGESASLDRNDSTPTPADEYARRIEAFLGTTMACQVGDLIIQLPSHRREPTDFHRREIESEARFNRQTDDLGQAYEWLHCHRARRHSWPEETLARQLAKGAKLQEYIILHFTKGKYLEAQEFNDLLYDRGLYDFMTGPHTPRLNTLSRVNREPVPVTSDSTSSSEEGGVSVEAAHDSSPPSEVATVSQDKGKAPEDQSQLKDELEAENDDTPPVMMRLPPENPYFNYDLMVTGFHRDAFSNVATDGASDCSKGPAPEQHPVRRYKPQGHRHRAQHTKRAKHLQNVVARRDVKDEQKGDVNHVLRMKAAKMEVKRRFGVKEVHTGIMGKGLEGQSWSETILEQLTLQEDLTLPADEETASITDEVSSELIEANDVPKEASELE